MFAMSREEATDSFLELPAATKLRRACQVYRKVRRQEGWNIPQLLGSKGRMNWWHSQSFEMVEVACRCGGVVCMVHLNED